jgi:hypothetical protein
MLKEMVVWQGEFVSILFADLIAKREAFQRQSKRTGILNKCS